jgi:hypothetical protein
MSIGLRHPAPTDDKEPEPFLDAQAALASLTVAVHLAATAAKDHLNLSLLSGGSAGLGETSALTGAHAQQLLKKLPAETVRLSTVTMTAVARPRADAGTAFAESPPTPPTSVVGDRIESCQACQVLRLPP